MQLSTSKDPAKMKAISEYSIGGRDPKLYSIIEK
jgi:hypothetical protein